jgi:hypothetical protein
MSSNSYLINILNKYAPKKLGSNLLEIGILKLHLQNWASTCLISIINSGSRAKGTAISIASDIDYLISLKSDCNAKNNNGLKGIYDSLYSSLIKQYSPVRKQNVSFRIKINELEIDITPARKHIGNSTDHWIYVSKIDSWRQTNIQKHINDISNSGRINEIKLLKIWRELNGIDFPSIYLEYLTIQILNGKSKDINNIDKNFFFLLKELAKEISNPLFNRIIDPASSTNILSDLLTLNEKNLIIKKANESIQKKSWNDIIW